MTDFDNFVVELHAFGLFNLPNMLSNGGGFGQTGTDQKIHRFNQTLDVRPADEVRQQHVVAHQHKEPGALKARLQERQRRRGVKLRMIECNGGELRFVLESQLDHLNAMLQGADALFTTRAGLDHEKNLVEFGLAQSLAGKGKVAVVYGIKCPRKNTNSLHNSTHYKLNSLHMDAALEASEARTEPYVAIR